MTARSGWRGLGFALVASVVVACSTEPGPTVVPADLTPAPTTAARATFAPPPTPEPSVDPNALPPTTTVGWWGDPDGGDCTTVGHFRIGYRVAQIGDCLGMTVGVPPELTLNVGEDFDLHMTIPADGAQPIWPLPKAEDPLIVDGWLAFDDATWTYRATLPGTTRLLSAAPCARGSTEPLGPTNPCAVLVVHVRDIKTRCVDLAADLCRAAGAAAAGVDGGVRPGQRIIGWVAEPDSLSMEWPGCGTVVAKVTLDLRDPDGQLAISLGQPAPETDPLRLAWCTY